MGFTIFFIDKNKEVAVKASAMFCREVKKRYKRNTHPLPPFQKEGSQVWDVWVDICGERTEEIKTLAQNCINYVKGKEQ